MILTVICKQNSLFIEMAMILWAMKLERPVDEKGAPVPIDTDGCIEAGVVVYVFICINRDLSAMRGHFFESSQLIGNLSISAIRYHSRSRLPLVSPKPSPSWSTRKKLPSCDASFLLVFHDDCRYILPQ